MPETPTTSRRTVVTGLGLAALGTAVTGCSQYGGSKPAGTSPASADTPQPSTSQGGTTLAKTSDIPVGGGTIFEQAKVVVTQPTRGTFKAFTAVCTHQGCIVATVEGGTINCPCHGSKYKITDGSVANPPAPRPLAELKITVQNGSIRLA